MFTCTNFLQFDWIQFNFIFWHILKVLFMWTQNFAVQFTCALHVFWIKRMRAPCSELESWSFGHNDKSVQRADMYVKDVNKDLNMYSYASLDCTCVQAILKSDWENSKFQAFTCLFLSCWSDYFSSTPVLPIQRKY